jgi:hypothetical protein
MTTWYVSAGGERFEKVLSMQTITCNMSELLQNRVFKNLIGFVNIRTGNSVVKYALVRNVSNIR